MFNVMFSKLPVFSSGSGFHPPGFTHQMRPYLPPFSSFWHPYFVPAVPIPHFFFIHPLCFSCFLHLIVCETLIFVYVESWNYAWNFINASKKEK